MFSKVINIELIHHKRVLKVSLANMQHFKFENWRIGEFNFWCHEQVTNNFFLLLPLESYIPNVLYKDFRAAWFWIFCWILTETVLLHICIQKHTNIFLVNGWIPFKKYLLAQSSHLNAFFYNIHDKKHV